MKRSADISDILKPLEVCQSQSCISDSMQVADILHWILSQTGPADVKISSFSISEEFLRRIYTINQSGLIRSIDILLDLKATNKTLLLWPFIEQTIRRCHLSATHSKVMLVAGESMNVAIVTSQNLTRGNRFESYFISSDPAIFASLAGDFDYIINNQSVPFHEIFSGTVGSD